jgi:hypothetical protein
MNAIRNTMPRGKVILDGTLQKRGEINRAFQDRYFELSDTCICYFDDAVGLIRGSVVQRVIIFPLPPPTRQTASSRATSRWLASKR